MHPSTHPRGPSAGTGTGTDPVPLEGVVAGVGGEAA